MVGFRKDGLTIRPPKNDGSAPDYSKPISCMRCKKPEARKI